MSKMRVAELARVNEDLRADYLDYLRRLKAQAATTIAELEGTGNDIQQDTAGTVLFKAETNQRIIEQFQNVIRELDEIFTARANGDFSVKAKGDAD